MDGHDEARRRQVEQRLAAVAGKEHLPKDLVDLVTRVTRLQLAAEPAAAAVISTGIQANLPAPDLHVQGRALIEPADFPYDESQARDLFEKILEVLESAGGAVSEAAALVRQDLSEGKLELEKVFAAFLRQDQEFFAPFAARSPKAPMTLPFLAQAALAPSLERVAAELLADRKSVV